MKSKITIGFFMFMTAFQFYKLNAQANNALSNLTSPTAVNQDILPDSDSTKDIGSGSKSWRNLYLSGKLYMADSLTLHAYPVSANFFAGTNAGSNISAFGNNNTGIGYYALKDISGGAGNTATGANALRYNISSYNTANGNAALYKNTTGSFNAGNGFYALYSNTNGNFNTATGAYALYSNTTGDDNTANAYSALYSNTTGNYNTAYGSAALTFNTTGSSNTATGHDALFYNATGNNNTAAGNYALLSNTKGSGNTAEGVRALYKNTTGSGNTAIGKKALRKNTTGNNNTAVGYYADANDSAYINSTAIGYYSVITAGNQVRIGNSDVTSIGGYTEWSKISDGRVKKNIHENVPGVIFINKLRPITYNLNLEAADKITQAPAMEEDDKLSQEDKDARQAKEQIVYTGFVAQDVEKAAKELNYNFSGVDAAKNKKDLSALRYAEFVVPLVKAVQELSKENEELKSRLDAIEQKLVAASQNKASAFVTLTDAGLEQNVPNPFTNTTAIHYTLPQKFSSAQIVFTDNTGKMLKQVNVSGAGKGTLTIDAATLTSGTYNYSLIVDGKIIGTKQMVLSK